MYVTLSIVILYVLIKVSLFKKKSYLQGFQMFIKEQLFVSVVVISLVRPHSIKARHEVWPYSLIRRLLKWPNFHGLLTTGLIGFHGNNFHNQSIIKSNKQFLPIHLIRFFVLILGAFTPPPQILAPVMRIPLKKKRITHTSLRRYSLNY